MKKNHYRILTGSLVLLSAALPANADLFWDGNDLTADADGGVGVWDTTTTNWDSSATAGTDSAWVNTQIAVFGGTGGAVSLASPGITAGGISVTSNGYTIQNNTLTLGAGTIAVSPGVETTMASTLAGGLTKTGAGTLILNGTNSYTGATVVSAGTLKIGAAAPNAFRYYRFNVTKKFTTTDGYNQICELGFFKTGLRTLAPAGTSSTGLLTGENNWNNTNDNLTQAGSFTKFGTGAMPYWLQYDFTTPTNFDGYNWATANDSTPARNPHRWTLTASVDGTNFTLLDERSQGVNAGPTALYTWSAANGTTFVAATNATPNAGAANAYPIPYSSRTSLPTGSPVQVAAGATFDLNGRDQRVGSLADSAGGGGTVTNSSEEVPVTLELGGIGNTNFSGVITDAGLGLEINLVKVGSGTQTLSGSASNTYSGTTTLGETGKLLLAKTGGAIAIPGDISIAFNGANGNATGLVLAGNEQIANTASITYPSTSYGGGPSANCYFRLNGYTETIRGLSSANAAAVVENRGLSDAAVYPASRLILDVPSPQSFTYNGIMRNIDGGTAAAGMTLGITKTGAGTQILTGGMGNATGAGEVNAGLLRINNTYGGTMLVTGTGTLDGTGTINGAITVTSGGIFTPGVTGAGTFTNAGGTTVNSGGTLTVAAGTTLAAPLTVNSGSTVSVATGATVTGATTVGTGGALTATGTLNGTATVASGGALTVAGSVANTLTVQSGGTLTVGNGGITTLTTGAGVSLAGTINMQVDKTLGVITNDKLSGFTTMTYGGTLALTFTGETPVLGEAVQLFVPPGGGATYAGSFTTVTGLPTLGAGTQWDLSELLTTGTIRVVDTASKPTFTPIGGDFMGAQSVTLSGDAGSTIYYTMDGSDPTPASPNGPTPVTGLVVPTDSDVTIKAYATLPGFTNSAIVTNVYHTVTLPKWITDANGDWTDTTKWDRGVTANGSGVTADFTLDQTAGRTVNLNATRTVGKLAFANANSFAWALSSSNSSTLILATPSGTPEIAVADVGTGVDVDTLISTAIAGTQGFTKTGLGTLALTGAKTYTGTVTIEDGRISVDAFASNGTNSPLGAGTTMVLNGGTLRYSNTGTSIGLNTFNRAITLGAEGGTLDTVTGGFWFVSGVMSGPGNLTKIGARQLIIQAANTYDGQTFVNEGEVQIRTVDSLGSTVGKTVVAAGARLASGGGLNGTVMENFDIIGDGGGNGALQANDGGTAVNYGGTVNLLGEARIGGGVNFTISGPVTGTGPLRKVTGNTVTLSGATSNTYTGVTTLGTNGKLLLAKTGGAIAIPGDIELSSTAWNGNNSGIVLGGDEQIADTAILTWTTTAYPTAGAQEDSFLRLNGRTETIGGLVAAGIGFKAAIENRGAGDGGPYVNGNLIINTTGTNSYSYNGGIRNVDGGAAGGGVVNITKTGTGTQIFTGGLGYTGTTTVNGGTLQIDSGGVNSPTTVNTGGTLKGTGSLTNTLTVNTGGTVAPGASAGTFTSGSLVITGDYACEIDGATADRLTVNGDATLTGSTLTFTVLNAPTASSYVLLSYTGTLTGTFAVTGLPAGYSVAYNATAKQVVLVKQGFGAFAATNGLSGNADDDFDKDGLADGIEYVLGTSPTANSAASGPTVAVTGGNLVFTFIRSDASMTPDTAVAVEVSSPLSAGSWVSYNVGADTASSAPEITVTDNGATDTITLTLPVGADVTKFARLKVTVTP